MTDQKFSFEGMEVGIIEESSQPRAPGHYHYMPFRGPGHLAMQEALKSKGKAKCYFEPPQEKVSFLVVACPEYGILQFEEFESEEKTKA